jgi:hypothetical protein
MAHVALMLVLLGAGLTDTAFADEVSKDQIRVVQSRKFAIPITTVVGALQEKLEEAGGKCYITVSYYPPGEGHNTGVGNCNFALSDKPSVLDKLARGASFIPLFGAALSWGISSKADSEKDKAKQSFVSVIRFEAIGQSKQETMLRVRAFTSRQKMISDENYYKELFAKIGEATQSTAEEWTAQDIDQ